MNRSRHWEFTMFRPPRLGAGLVYSSFLRELIDRDANLLDFVVTIEIFPAYLPELGCDGLRREVESARELWGLALEPVECPLVTHSVPPKRAISARSGVGAGARRGNLAATAAYFSFRLP